MVLNIRSINGTPDIKHELEISTILSRGYFMNEETFTLKTGPNNELTITPKTSTPNFSSMTPCHYMNLTNIDKALRYPTKKPHLLLSYEPVPSDSNVPRMHISSYAGMLYFSQNELKGAEKKPNNIEIDEDYVKLNYDFLDVEIECKQCGNNEYNISNKKEIHLKTIIHDNHPEYERIVIIETDDNPLIKPLVETGLSSSKIVYNYLEITGLIDLIKEYPPILLDDINSEHLRLKVKTPDALRVVLDLFPNLSGSPKLYISPIEKRIFMTTLSMEYVKQRPTHIIATPEELSLTYPFLEVSINYEPDEKELKWYFGNRLKLE